ncbi:4'-phosphopantetheinyl transferase family protein [Streptomyces uncialis]|uniref:4'-phosphopantetheinyl transferase family protein n=1 Tax=Streptomyces uncialis TaxID=1048205 RepID=UPI0037876131
MDDGRPSGAAARGDGHAPRPEDTARTAATGDATPDGPAARRSRAVVRIWVLDADTAHPAAERRLSPSELARAREPAMRRVRPTYVTSRALQRTLGARYLGTPAEHTDISRTCFHCRDDGHGKPWLPAAPELDFSVSHTAGLVVLAASTDTRVGVDVEAGDRTIETGGMTRLLASDSERRHLPATDGDTLRRALLRLWARKEATLKLTGHGLLHVPFRELSVDGRTARIGTPPVNWPTRPIHLADLSLEHGYAAALATTRARPEITVIPLAQVADLSW